MGVNGNLPFRPSNNRKRSSLPYTVCENTQDNVHYKPHLLQHATIQNIHTWIKKTSDYLQTKLSVASQQLSAFPLTAAVQHIIQLAQITCTVCTVPCGDMSQLHTIHIIQGIPVVAHIAIYSRGIRHDVVGTSHINPTIRQHTFTIQIFRKMQGCWGVTGYLLSQALDMTARTCVMNSFVYLTRVPHFFLIHHSF